MSDFQDLMEAARVRLDTEAARHLRSLRRTTVLFTVLTVLALVLAVGWWASFWWAVPVYAIAAAVQGYSWWTLWRTQ